VSITVLVPTRERPHQAFLTYESFKNTVAEPDTEIVFGLDFADPSFRQYHDILPGWTLYESFPAHSGSFQKVLNGMAKILPSEIYGSIGDDHRFKTKGWDTRVKKALQKPGIAYANDLYQRDVLPTAAFMSTEISNALGWFALPVCDHLYIDNAWKDIGLGIDSLHYLPDVIIEHLHYTNGKSIMDEGYKRTNAASQFSKDGAAYLNWRANHMLQDIARVRRALDAPNRTTT
jgi:hypothetical protein